MSRRLVVGHTNKIWVIWDIPDIYIEKPEIPSKNINSFQAIPFEKLQNSLAADLDDAFFPLFLFSSTDFA